MSCLSLNLSSKIKLSNAVNVIAVALVALPTKAAEVEDEVAVVAIVVEAVVEDTAIVSAHPLAMTAAAIVEVEAIAEALPQAVVAVEVSAMVSNFLNRIFMLITAAYLFLS